MVAYDGSDQASAALYEAASWLQGEGNKIVIAAVVELYNKKNFFNMLRVDFDFQILDDANEQMLERTRDLLASVKSMLEEKNPHLNIVTVARTGEPREELVKIAIEYNADAVVVGSRGLGKVERAVLGSVSNYLVNNCPCSVFVVRNKA